MSELLPCRKCGSYNYQLWDGRGTQPEMYCNNCGQSENVQLCDLFLHGDERRHAGFIDDEYHNRPDIVEYANNYLFNEWNTRHVSPLQQARLDFIEAYRAWFLIANTSKIHNRVNPGEAKRKLTKAWNHLQQLEGG